MEKENSRQLELLEALYSRAQAMSESLDQLAAAEQCARTSVELLGADMAWLGRAEEDGSVSIFSVFPHGHSYPPTISVRFDDTPEGQGPTGRAIRSGLAQITDDVLTDPAFAPWRPVAEKYGFRSTAALPLISRGRMFGALNLYSDRPGFFSAEQPQIFQTFAHQVASALENARLFSDLERKNRELLRAYETTIEGWARALALKEQETEEHSQRLVELATEVARAMGMSEDDIVHLRRGTLLHDIGKIGIPDSILLKPGKLTEVERLAMRQHPVYAFEMLSPIFYLRRAIDIPYAHHERWDGTGYPRGLQGEQIPLAARIFRVVDVWDALTRNRPYRKAWSEKRTLAYIRSRSGRSFDPKVVAVFRKIIENRGKKQPA